MRADGVQLMNHEPWTARAKSSASAASLQSWAPSSQPGSFYSSTHPRGAAWGGWSRRCETWSYGSKESGGGGRARSGAGLILCHVDRDSLGGRVLFHADRVSLLKFGNDTCAGRPSLPVHIRPAHLVP